MSDCGIDVEATIEDAVADMRKYYTKEDEEKYGVLGIGIKLLPNGESDFPLDKDTETLDQLKNDIAIQRAINDSIINESKALIAQTNLHLAWSILA